MKKKNETFQQGLKRILSKKVYELALKNTHHKRRKRIHNFIRNHDILTGAFYWGNTKQGLDFWHTEWLKIEYKQRTGKTLFILKTWKKIYTTKTV